jgi:uncharacterized protein (TIGR03435 family)
MNALQILSSEAWVERLGWTLVHFLWQGLSIVALYAAARRRVMRTASPHARYLLACAAMAAMMAAPLLTWGLVPRSDASPDAAYRVRSTPPSVAGAGVAATRNTLPASVQAEVSGVQPAQFLLWVVITWFAGVAVFWARLAGGWVVAARMRSVLVRCAPPEWQDTLRKLGERIGLSSPVKLLVSGMVEVPAVVGWLRPVVLVPVGALAGLPAEHLEALLLHELAHIRRHDYLFNILQSVAEALLFYHPAVWWVSGHIRAERELCCDDVAVSVTGDALTYARALAQLESYRPAHLSAAVAAHGGSLSDRIARLLGRPRPAVRTGPGPGVLAVSILLVAAGYALFGQSGAHPSFQAASIKRNTFNWSEPTHHAMGGGYQPGGRLHLANLSLVGLIQFAYADHDSAHWLPLPPSQVAGGPAWTRTDGYDIDAKPEGTTDPRHMWLMLQTLLADRFKLALHRERRELPVYDLEPAKGGPNLPAPKDVVCVSFPPGTPPRHVPGKVDCGYVSFSLESTAVRLEGSKIRMADLAGRLAMMLGRPVLDRTGFRGEFDLRLKFTPEGARFPSDRNLPNIFAALEEQLGLKLVPAKGPVDVLVIDHAERPAAD